MQEVAKPSKERYPPRTLYGIRRFLAEKKLVEDINLLSTSDKSFVIFRTALDAEMKDVTRAGVALQNKKAEKFPVTEEEESKFWELELLGCQSAKSLLNTVYC